MIRVVALFALSCAVSSAVAYCLLKSYTDGRVAVVQSALDNLSVVHETRQKEAQKEVADLKARLGGKPKEEAKKPAAASPPESPKPVEVRAASPPESPKPVEVRATSPPESPKPVEVRSVTEQPLPALVGRIEEIVITNSAGDIFTNLKLSKVVADGILFEYRSGLVKAKWSELPVWCQLKYLDAALDAASKDRQAGRASTQTAPPIGRAQGGDAAKKSVDEAKGKEERDGNAANTRPATSWVIKGRIVQKTRDGLFVQSVGGHAGERRNTGTSAVNPNSRETIVDGGVQVFEGLCLLRNHPEQAALADGEQVEIQATESGQYQYTAVSGAVRSIRQFTVH
jgi:hypothetical protein